MANKKLIKIDKNGSKHWEGMNTCDRCQGRGWYATGTCNGQLVPSRVDQAVCWKCHGTGTVYMKWIERTPEYEAKLEARRKAKTAARMAEAEEQRKAYEAQMEAERLAKEAEEARIKAEKAISQYVGQEGDKINTTATFDHTAWFDFKMGWMEQRMYIHTFKDPEGNKLVWKTSSNSLPNLEEGDTVQITGTVKEHSTYQDEKQTVLTRCKIKKI